jgi:pimeloyl-ACP methyl ester carboxylesterase
MQNNWHLRGAFKHTETGICSETDRECHDFSRYCLCCGACIGFNSNMDGWDPAVTNSLAADHEVVLFDKAGVGASGGKTPYTIVEMTHHCVAFCRALGLKATYVVGFSLGGMIAQQLALDHPHLVQSLILLGTGPCGGEDMTFTELSPEEQSDPVAFLLGAFFSPSEASEAAGREYMKRLESRKEDRDIRRLSFTAIRILWLRRSTRSFWWSTCQMLSSSYTPIRVTGRIISMQRYSWST